MPACCPGTSGAGRAKGAARFPRSPLRPWKSPRRSHATPCRAETSVLPSLRGSSKLGRPTAPGEPAVPEPPDAAVAEALTWAVRADPGYRMLQRARAAVTEAQKDDFYAAAAAQARRAQTPRRIRPNGRCVKRCSAAGISRRSPSPPAGRVPTSCTYIAAIGLGVEEVGAEALRTRLQPPACSHSCPRRSGGTR